MTYMVVKRDGSTQPFDDAKIERAILWACKDLNVDPQAVKDGVIMLVRPNIPTAEIQQSLVLSAAKLIKRDCMDATKVAARLALLDLYSKVNRELGNDGYDYPALRTYLERAVHDKLLNPALLEDFDLEALEEVIEPENDKLFEYLGITILTDRYLIRSRLHAGVKESGEVIELPQHFLMRVSMGLALGEGKGANCTKRAIEFYKLFSSHDYLASTPTLFNSGTLHSQLSSCYLNTVADTLTTDDEANRYASIYGTLEECARLSKYAGGIGTDWTRVRSSGDVIQGTQGKSSGTVPYLKVYNDTAVAVNQGGKRKGSFAPYLELWHPDIWQFCELKKNSGDERVRAHDIFPAAWTCDLFMERVINDIDGMWSFFSPNEYPELHELYGDEFKVRYEELEAAGAYRSQMPVKQLWKKILTSLFETGHPWMTFKDACNLRSPQRHAGVIHSSNLCTEITLNTSDDETAVCNLGSINLSHVRSPAHLRRTIRTAIRMLDNVIDINFYPSARAKNSNLRHRPIGLGVMGLGEYLIKNGIAFDSEEALEEQDFLFELISYYAIEASSDLAAERGAYPSFEGSDWSKGIMPIDTYRDLIARRPKHEWQANTKTTLDWDALREKVKTQGMRNSNVMAIAPTATISNILGTTPCIEPPYELECVKSNLSGPFDWIDPSLRYEEHAHLVKAAFEIDQTWVLRAAAVRQKWIDQSQSVNIFAKLGTKGKDLSNWYKLAWILGLKTTYYLRNQSEEAAKAVKSKPVAVTSPKGDVMEQELNMCSIDSPDCEACQ